jgi:hypothetical protein
VYDVHLSFQLFAMYRQLPVFLFILLLSLFSNAQKPAPEYYQIKVYQFAKAEQETSLDTYLKNAYLPGLHKAGIKKVGVFKPITNDTAAVKKIYVFMVSPALDKLAALPIQLKKDSGYIRAAKEYMGAAFDQSPFSRIETILLRAFRLAPQMKLPALKNNKSERIYELRSYESATEKLYEAKVKMFNEGGEIALFKRLDFNAVFYADVISGSRMPNLMYMTSFENKAEREAHWESFRNDPAWKRLSALPEYQHTVSKAEIILLHAAEYSDF